MNTFKIEIEYDLHTKVVDYIRNCYPTALITASLGELQDTPSKRIESYKKGYLKGQPDIIISELHKRCNGFCIELKTPKNNGLISEHQFDLLEKYKMRKYKCLISSKCDECVREITLYINEVRLPCQH